MMHQQHWWLSVRVRGRTAIGAEIGAPHARSLNLQNDITEPRCRNGKFIRSSIRLLVKVVPFVYGSQGLAAHEPPGRHACWLRERLNGLRPVPGEASGTPRRLRARGPISAAADPHLSAARNLTGPSPACSKCRQPAGTSIVLPGPRLVDTIPANVSTPSVAVPSVISR